MVRYGGTVRGATGPLVGLTFALYKTQQGGSPLWLETQSVPVDGTGHYTVQLGATLPGGLPKEVFVSGEARWLGVQPEGQAEQQRVLLLSVPYALKAADAETLGGFPLSAFVLAAPATAVPASGTFAAPLPAAAVPPPNAAVTGAGIVNAIPLWDTASDIVSSVMTQTGSGTSAHIGINTTTPASTLDVKGAGTFRGTLGLTSSGAATSTTGKASFPLLLSATAFNSGTATSVTQNFRWQAEPVANNTANPSGKLSLLSYSGSSAPTETGLSIASNGQFTFAAGQTFPGTGTITAVSPGTGLKGGGNSGSVTLSVDTTKVPLLAAANIFSAVQTINGTENINAAASTILNVTATNAGSHAPMAQFGSAGSNATDANSIRVYNGGSASGTFAEMFVAAPGAFIPGTLAGDGGMRVAQGQNMWFGDSSAARMQLDEFGNLHAFGSVAASDSAFDGLGAAIVGKGFSGPDTVNTMAGYFLGGTGFSHNGVNGATGVYAKGGDGDGDGGFFVGGSADEEGGEPAGDGISAVVGAGVVGLPAYAGSFSGDVTVSGTLTAAVKNFRIDHPLDPSNKYLNHASIESSEMLNLYTGNAVLDTKGEADVALPGWFEAANSDFRYTLTSIGAPGPNLYIAQEISGGHFRIAGGHAGAKVSWQVSAVRQDAYAKAHPLVVEQAKAGRERGHFLHPELYGATAEQSIFEARHPGVMRKAEAIRAKVQTSRKTVSNKIAKLQ